MKITMIIVRTLLGLVFLFSSISFLFNLFPAPELEGDMKEFMEGFEASHYLLQVVKVTELVCGIAFVTGRLVPLAAVVIFPITVNIIFVHAILAPQGLPLAIFVLVANLFLAYYYRERYKPLFSS